MSAFRRRKFMRLSRNNRLQRTPYTVGAAEPGCYAPSFSWAYTLGMDRHQGVQLQPELTIFTRVADSFYADDSKYLWAISDILLQLRLQ